MPKKIDSEEPSPLGRTDIESAAREVVDRVLKEPKIPLWTSQ